MLITIDHTDLLNVIRDRLEHEMNKLMFHEWSKITDGIARAIAQAVIARAEDAPATSDERPCMDKTCSRPADRDFDLCWHHRAYPARRGVR